MLTDTRIIGIESDNVLIVEPGGTEALPGRLPADTVVASTGARPNDNLADELRKVVEQVFVVGDAVEPRDVTYAMLEGARAGMVVLISDSSIASSLAVANDTTFRLIPDDKQLGIAIAALMTSDGISVIIPMERDDVWAKGLINATTAAFSAGGGTVMDEIRYNPDASNFSAELDTLRMELDDALSTQDNESVAIYLLSFEEGALVMSQARAMDDPLLSSVRWYGGDGSAVTFSQNASAAKFAKTTKFVFPRYGNESSETFLRLRERLGMEPDTVSVNAYDALWLITQTYLAVGSNKSEIFRAGLPQVAKTLVGSYGSLALNEAGDRNVTYYEFLTLESINGTMQWRPLARYVSGPEQGENITFFSQ
jgi:branched-chain amino acid transport system substrate-binding protein